MEIDGATALRQNPGPAVFNDDPTSSRGRSVPSGRTGEGDRQRREWLGDTSGHSATAYRAGGVAVARLLLPPASNSRMPFGTGICVKWQLPNLVPDGWRRPAPAPKIQICPRSDPASLSARISIKRPSASCGRRRLHMSLNRRQRILPCPIRSQPIRRAGATRLRKKHPHRRSSSPKAR